MFGKAIICAGVCAIALLVVSAGAKAQPTVMGGAPSADDIVRALSARPPADDSGAPPADDDGPVIHRRGIKPTSSAQPVQPATPAALPSVALKIDFAYNSADLTPQARDVVKQIAIALKSSQLGQARFRVEGHTDARGSDSYNQSLSQRRADAVKSALVHEFGLPADRLESIGLGKNQLIDPANPTSDVNRRVLLVNLG